MSHRRRICRRTHRNCHGWPISLLLRPDIGLFHWREGWCLLLRTRSSRGSRPPPASHHRGTPARRIATVIGTRPSSWCSPNGGCCCSPYGARTGSPSPHSSMPRRSSAVLAPPAAELPAELLQLLPVTDSPSVTSQLRPVAVALLAYGPDPGCPHTLPCWDNRLLLAAYRRNNHRSAHGGCGGQPAQCFVYEWPHCYAAVSHPLDLRAHCHSCRGNG